MSKIPKPSRTKSNIVPNVKSSFCPIKSGLTFSFEVLERTEFFNLDGTCQNWSSEMLDMMKEICKHSEAELFNGQYRSFRIHNHEKADCPSTLPDGVELKDCYQIRISASKGGIHGVFRENVFYVIWLDPLHNMYPDDRFGGLRKVKAPSTCCKDRDEEIVKLKEELEKALKRADEWERFAKGLIEGT